MPELPINKDTSRSQAFTYDPLNRLISAQNAGTDWTKMTVTGKTEYWGNSYGYDPWDNLLQKTATKCGAENLSITALYTNQLSCYGYDSAGNMNHHANTGNNYTFDQEKSHHRCRLFFRSLEDSICHHECSRGIAEDEDYYPWGGELQFVNNDPNHYKFTGKERDAETGVDYFGARYYGNWLGRFSSPDEPFLDQDPENPQSWNLYSYALDNPLRFGDADGRSVTVCVKLQGGGQHCELVSDKDYEAARAADQAKGINAPQRGQSGNITCGGTVCGHVYDGCLPCQADAIVPLGLGPGEAILLGPGRGLFGSLARAGEEAAELSAKMAAVRAAGKAGEIAAGIVKNTRRILSETGTVAFRVPDILDDATKVIGEVKNVPGKVSLTSQIRDDIAWAQKNGYSFELHVTQSTTFTRPLQNLISSGTVTVVRF